MPGSLSEPYLVRGARAVPIQLSFATKIGLCVLLPAAPATPGTTLRVHYAASPNGRPQPEQARSTAGEAIENGQRLRLSCSFDNGGVAQPELAGVRQLPRYVVPGEGRYERDVRWQPFKLATSV